MTIEKLQTLWYDFASRTGYSRLQCCIVMSKNVFEQICSDSSFLNFQQFLASIGANTTWKAMFERRGMPKVILIEAEDVLEFVSNL